MKKTILAIILASFVTPSYADAKDELCPVIANIATSIMTAHQNGVPLSTMMFLINQEPDGVAKDLTISLILSAYSTPLYNNESIKNQAITAFGNGAATACYLVEE